LNSITNAFNNAAQTYSQFANLQRLIAQDFAQDIIINFNGEGNIESVLEIGCGTGFLTESLLPKIKELKYYLATDLAPNMVEVAKNNSEINADFKGNLEFKVADANKTNHLGNFDLVASSMTFQWLEDLQSTLTKLMQQTKNLAFTTIIDGSFQEWHSFCNNNNLPINTIDFIPLEHLKEICRQAAGENHNYEINVKEYKDWYDSPSKFLINLKKTGAHTSRPKNMEHTPTKNNLMRIKNNQEPFAVTYLIATCFISKHEN